MAYPNSFICGDQAAMLALIYARINDICFRTDIQETFILTALPPTSISSWSQIAPSEGDIVESVFGRVGAIVAQTGDYEFSQLAEIPSTIIGIVSGGLMADYQCQPTDTVASLKDYSGNGNNATGTVGVAPTIAANGGLVCAGTGAVLLPSSLNSALTVQIFVSYQGSGNNSGNRPNFPVAGNGNGSASNALQFGFYPPNSNETASGFGTNVVGGKPLIAYDGGAQDVIASCFNGIGSISFVFGQSSNNTINEYYINGLPEQDGLVFRHASAGLQTVGEYQLGGCAAGSGALAANYFTGVIYRVLFYSTQLTSAQIQQNHNAMVAQLAGQGVNPNSISNAPTQDELLLVGDSITAGYETTIPWAASLNITQGSFNIDNDGCNGYKLTDFLSVSSNFDCMLKTNGGKNCLVIWAGTNDLANGADPSTVVGSLGAFCRARRIAGWKVIVVTMLSRVSNDANKNAYNTLIRQLWPTFADGLADVAANPNLGADGAYSDTTYFNTDQIHPTNLSATSIIAPIISSAINRLYGNTLNSGNPNQVKVGQPSPFQRVQWARSAGNGSGSTATVEFNLPTTTGNHIFVLVAYNTTAATVTGISDSQSNTYVSVHAAAVVTGNWKVQPWHAIDITGGVSNTITVTFSSASVGEIYLIAVEHKGIATSTPVDATSAIATGVSYTPSTAAVTTSEPNDVLIAYGTSFNFSGTDTAGIGYNLIQTGNIGIFDNYFVQFKIAVLAGSYSADCVTDSTVGEAVNWSMGLIAYLQGIVGSVFQIADSDVYLEIDSSGGNIQANLPDAIGCTGQIYTVKNIGSGNTLTIGTVNSETIDGNSTVTIGNLGVKRFRSDLVSASVAGANWVTL
jgi:hypothetical protein